VLTWAEARARWAETEEKEKKEGGVDLKFLKKVSSK
jgi:hypothetical protein